MARADRLAEIRPQHQHIADLVALHLNIEPEEVLEGLIDYRRHLDLIDSFLAEGGRHTLTFTYQLLSPKPMGRFVLYGDLNERDQGNTGGHSIAPKTTSANAASASP